MPKLGEYLQIKDAAKYLGVCQNTLRNWEAHGKIAVSRAPSSRYRLFKRTDLEKLARHIDKTGKFPTGWKRYAPLSPKPR